MEKTYEPSRTVGPEDLAKGQYITVTHRMHEYVADDCAGISHKDVVIQRFTVLAEDAGRALKVVSVCLPFVLVCNTQGKRETLDLRRYQIALLNRDFGREAFKELRIKQKQEKAKAAAKA